tara:strand:- start:144 stop:545 length:402 start_codon:yes stop_codon:yes gene_type:complete
MEKDLDRTSGYHFLLYALYGEDFEQHLGTTMSDDQKNLHSLIQRLEGGETAEAIHGEDSIGVLNDGVEAEIDLRSVTHVKLDEIKYTVASPLLSELPDTSFSRDVLLNNPEKILTSLQQSGAVAQPEDLDELS